MARIRVHTPCMRPVSECDCPSDPDDADEPFELDDGSDDEEAA